MIKIKKFFMWFRIPRGIYCYGKKTCPYWKHIKVIRHNKKNCEFADSCTADCKKEKCRTSVTRCEYMYYTDKTQESLLWDQCKECGVKNK